MLPSVADAVARNRALRLAAGRPVVLDDPAVWRVVASVLADHASAAVDTPRTPVGGRNRPAGVNPPGSVAASA